MNSRLNIAIIFCSILISQSANALWGEEQKKEATLAANDGKLEKLKTILNDVTESEKSDYLYKFYDLYIKYALCIKSTSKEELEIFRLIIDNHPSDSQYYFQALMNAKNSCAARTSEQTTIACNEKIAKLQIEIATSTNQINTLMSNNLRLSGSVENLTRQLNSRDPTRIPPQ